VCIYIYISSTRPVRRGEEENEMGGLENENKKNAVRRLYPTTTDYNNDFSTSDTWNGGLVTETAHQFARMTSVSGTTATANAVIVLLSYHRYLNVVIRTAYTIGPPTSMTTMIPIKPHVPGPNRARFRHLLCADGIIISTA